MVLALCQDCRTVHHFGDASEVHDADERSPTGNRLCACGGVVCVCPGCQSDASKLVLADRLESMGYDLDALERDNPFWPAGYDVVLSAEFGAARSGGSESGFVCNTRTLSNGLDQQA